MKRTLGAVLGGALLLGGCGQGAVSRSQLQSDISKQVAAQVHLPAPKVDCPKDLPGKVGASERCVLTDPSAGHPRLPVDVRVDSVNGSRVNFKIQVGRTPLN